MLIPLLPKHPSLSLFYLAGQDKDSSFQSSTRFPYQKLAGGIKFATKLSPLLNLNIASLEVLHALAFYSRKLK